MSTQQEFIQNIEGEMTAEEVAKMIELGEGVTSDTTDEKVIVPGDDDQKAADAEDDAAEKKDGKQVAAEPDESEMNADNTVIAGKSGKYTIGFEKLEEARSQRDEWKQRADAAQRELDALKQQAQTRADDGKAATTTDKLADAAQQAIDNGVDPDIFGDFSEEAMAKGIAKLIAQQGESTRMDVEKLVNDRLAEALAPLQKQQATAAVDSHYDAIYKAHPDADSIAESKELSDWIASQPKFAQAGYNQVLQNGSTSDVIELFDTFKAATGATQSAPADQAKAAAKAVIDKAAPAVPNSLSDIPGGKVGATSRADALSGMENGADIFGVMDDMTPEQIEAHLNRI